MKFKKIILNPNLLYRREIGRFVSLLSPHFVGYEIQIKTHQLGKTLDYVEIQNFGTQENSYRICFNVCCDKEGITLKFNVSPGSETPEYENLKAAEYEKLGYGTKLQIQNFDLSRLDDPTTVLQLNEFLKDGTIPEIR